MTLESRLDMPTEETTLLREEEASVKKSAAVKRTAGGMMCAFAALALVSSSSTRAIPTNMDQLMAGLPVWSFLLVLALQTVRALCDAHQTGPGVLLYACSLPYAIMNKACDGSGGDWGAHIAQLAVTVGMVATVLDQLPRPKENPENGFLGVGKYINAAAAGMLAVGTAKVVFTSLHQPGQSLVEMFKHALPFLGWAATSILMAVSIALGNKGAIKAGQAMWLLVLYTAAELGAGPTTGDSINAQCLKYSCILGAAWSVVNFFSLCDTIEDLAVAAVMAAMFMPLAYNTITKTDLTVDAIMKNTVAFLFAATLALHAATSLLGAIVPGEEMQKRITAIGSAQFLAIFMLCFIVANKSLIAAEGEATQFAKYAGKLSEYGPVVGLVMLVLSPLKLLFPDAKWLADIVRYGKAVAEGMMLLGILLGN